MLTMYVRGYSTQENDLKCEIQKEQEIFKYLKNYDHYSDVVENKGIPNLRRDLIKLSNTLPNITEEIQENIQNMLSFINEIQKTGKGLYWY